MTTQKPKRDFKGIWIPKEVWENTDLSLQEKVFYVEIDSLDNEDGCYANNNYFARFFGLTTRQVQRVVASLVEKNLISIEVSKDDGNLRTLRIIGRKLTTKMSLASRQKRSDPHDENVVHNNTNLNNTDMREDRPTPAQEAREFFADYKKQETVIAQLVEQGMHKAVAAVELSKFVSYWTEKNKSGTRQKWELETTFEISRRLATWFRNAGKFNKNIPQQVNTVIL